MSRVILIHSESPDVPGDGPSGRIKLGLHGLVRKMLADRQGATAVEYGLIAGLAALGIAGGLSAMADLVILVFDLIVQAVAAAVPSP